MLYDEFLEGTGCRATEFNYEVYKSVELLYMNSDMTKEEAYAIGKMRVDNSLTDSEKEEIKEYEEQIARSNEQLEYYKEYCYMGSWEEVQAQHKRNKEFIAYYKNDIKKCKEWIKSIKDRAK